MKKTFHGNQDATSKPKTPFAILTASALAFMAFMTFPFLVHAELVRAYFREWSLVAIEFSLFALVLILFSSVMLIQQSRDTDRGDDPLSPP